ncbi:hypothetical protein Tco_0186189 [Tanacetum coccineum]
MDWGEVNPTHAYYNGSRTSKDNEDPSWNTSFKTRRTQKTTSAMEALWKTKLRCYFYLLGTFRVRPDIQFAVSACSRHQVTPLTSNLNAVKKIFELFLGRPNSQLGLNYGTKRFSLCVDRLCDSDNAGS